MNLNRESGSVTLHQNVHSKFLNIDQIAFRCFRELNKNFVKQRQCELVDESAKGAISDK